VRGVIGKLRSLERRLLDFAADAYTALRALGLSPEAAGRVVTDVIRISNKRTTRKWD
jgi:hypothetical protein